VLASRGRGRGGPGRARPAWPASAAGRPCAGRGGRAARAWRSSAWPCSSGRSRSPGPRGRRRHDQPGARRAGRLARVGPAPSRLRVGPALVEVAVLGWPATASPASRLRVVRLWRLTTGASPRRAGGPTRAGGRSVRLWRLTTGASPRRAGGPRRVVGAPRDPARLDRGGRSTAGPNEVRRPACSRDACPVTGFTLCGHLCQPCGLTEPTGSDTVEPSARVSGSL
jgi:hypothetical protein